jgi:FkbM family methyltransferase
MVLRSALPAPIARAIHHWRVMRSVARFEPRLVQHRYGDIELRVQLSDPLSAGWYDHDWQSLPEIRFLRAKGALQPADLVFDVGAHQGVVALMLAAEVPQGRVIAIEAEPHNARVAEINRRLNHAENVEVQHAAIAAGDGIVRFAEGLNGHVADGALLGTVEVPAVTVDTLARQHGVPDLVSLDVEGYEGKALDGATDVLGNGRTVWCVEVHVGSLVDCAAADIAARFSDHRCYVTGGPPPHPDADTFRPLEEVGVPSERFFLAALPR